MNVIIVKSATIAFKKDGNTVGQAEIQNIKNDIIIDGSYTWNENGKMVITNTGNIPFGVMDFQIKRYM